MQLLNLTVTNMRGIDRLRVDFDPRLNVLVGINGVGKSTLLDAVRVNMSRVIPLIAPTKARPLSYNEDDFRVNSRTPIEVAVEFSHTGRLFGYTRRQWRDKIAEDVEENVTALRRRVLETERGRRRPRALLREIMTPQSTEPLDEYHPSRADLKQIDDADGRSPLCVFYSTTRAVPSDSSGRDGKAPSGRAAAYVDALQARPLQLGVFAEWIGARQELAAEHAPSRRHLDSVRKAVTQFLPGYTNLRASTGRPPRLLIDKGTTTLDVRQLSDGERGVLALVIDLSRRLSQAGGSAADRMPNGEALVLIDEIDLHLHPQWQRQILRKLTRAFPKCQFIVTTHSPTVITEVQPAHLRVLRLRRGRVEVERRGQSYGLEVGQIMRDVMKTPPRPEPVTRAIRRIQEAIDSGDLSTADDRLAAVRTTLNGPDPETVGLAAEVANLNALGDALDSEEP